MRLVALGQQFRVTVQGVGVEVDLAVDASQFAVFTQRQRVHFEQGEIVGHEGFVGAQHQLGEFANLLAREAQGKRAVASLERLHADQRVHFDLDDLFRGFFGDLLDFHTAFGGHHEHHALGTAVNHGAQVQFALYRVHVFAHQHAVHRLTGGVGLIGHQIGADQGLGDFGGFFAALHHFHATCLATATGVDLGLHNGKLATQLVVSSGGFFRRVSQNALLHRQAVLGQQLFRLVFVQVHL